MRTVSPFVNWHSIQSDIIMQKEQLNLKMKKFKDESDYFNMIYKEIDEDDSEEEGANLN